ncbi:protein kinase [Streptomyces sp. SBC-4]|nr:protein kinase [Streptomyces sp. SBC-4]MDV5148071.1 protein kinase [Streptomyces sp. SBC-4]
MGEAALRSLGAALAEALEAIHACGLVHRDLKPGNIVMAPDGPRVLDFGIARALESTRLTATGSAFGTPGYLAPEQALGEEVTGAADVFALGAVLVAAAGGRPFGDGTPMGLMYRSVHEAPDLATVPEALRGLVGRCLAKNPAERPTPDEILDVLGAGVSGAVDAVRDAMAPPVRDTVSVQDAVPPSVRDTVLVQDTVPAPVQPTPTLVVPPPPPLPPGPAPDFVAADRVGGIAVDADGVSIHLFGEEADFGWAEIGAVEYGRLRRGRGLRITVSLYDGTTYVCEVDGRRAARVDEWTALLDLVLDRYLPGV